MDMGTSLSDYKKAVLCNKNYVYLDGKWRHKGGGPSVSEFAVYVLGDEDFAGAVNRYEAALSRRVHKVHLGTELFMYDGE